MANSWFRLYAEFAHDPKVQVLTEALQRRYVMALCLHCDNRLVNRPDDEIALSLRVTVEDWQETKQILIKRGLLLENLEPHGWNKRQYISDIKDPTAAQRQKRYRERKSVLRNAPVTLRLPEADTDTDTDTEVEQSRADSAFQKIYEAGVDIFPQLAVANTSAIHQWIAAGCDPDLDAVPEIRRHAGTPVKSWKYFSGGIADAKATRTTPLQKGSPNGRFQKPKEQKSNVGTL